MRIDKTIDTLVIDEFDAHSLHQIAELHRKNLGSGFLSTLGERLLTLLYQEIQRYPGGVLIAAEADGQIAGFVAGVDNVRRFYRWFFRRNSLRGAMVIWSRLFSVKSLRRIFETVRYSRRSTVDKNLPQAELLSIAVDEAYRRQGTAELLYRALESHCASTGIDSFRIVVGKQLEPALSFYEKMGAERVSEIEVHAGEESWLLVQDVAAKQSSTAYSEMDS